MNIAITITSLLLIIKIGNCLSVSDGDDVVSKTKRKRTILDQFYDYVDEVKRRKEIEDEAKMVNENLAKRKNLLVKQVGKEGVRRKDDAIRMELPIWQKFASKKNYGDGNLKEENFGNSLKTDHRYKIIPLIDELLEQKPSKRYVRESPEMIPVDSDISNDVLEKPSPQNLDERDEFPAQPNGKHVSEIKVELNKLQDLVEILRDQQYILSLLNNVEANENHFPNNSSKKTDLKSAFENFENSLNHKQVTSDAHGFEETNSQARNYSESPIEEATFSPTNLDWNERLELLNLKKEIDQLKTLVSAIVKKRKQDGIDDQEKKLAKELDVQKKEIVSLKEMLLNLSKSLPNLNLGQNNASLREAEDENDDLQNMLAKLRNLENKLSKAIAKNSVDESPGSDEILGSIAGVEHKFHKNKLHVLPKTLNKTAKAREADKSYQSRASDADNEFRSILSMLSDTSQPNQKKELARVQKELETLRKLSQNENDDASNVDELLKELGIQRDDSFELNSESDIADKIFDLENQIKTSKKKADVQKKLRQLEREIKSLNGKDENRSQLVKLLKKLKDVPAQSKSLEENDDLTSKLNSLKDAIDDLQPKEEEASLEEEGKENANFELILQKLISNKKPSVVPSKTKQKFNKFQIQTLTKKLAAMINKHPDEDVPEYQGGGPMYNCKYGGANHNSYPDPKSYGQADGNYGNKVFSPYGPSFGGHSIQNLVPYRHSIPSSSYGYNNNPNSFPQNFIPYPNRYLQGNQMFGPTNSYNAPLYDPSDEEPNYVQEQPTYAQQQQPQQPQNINYNAGNYLFPAFKGGDPKAGYLKTPSETPKTGSAIYAAGPQKPQYNSQQNPQINDAYTQERITDLRKQIYNLQSVINRLNKPEYLQQPEDKLTAYQLDKQITDLKNVINYLSQNSKTSDYNSGNVRQQDQLSGQQVYSTSPNRNRQIPTVTKNTNSSPEYDANVNYQPYYPNPSEISGSPSYIPSSISNSAGYQEHAMTSLDSSNSNSDSYQPPLESQVMQNGNGDESETNSRYRRSLTAEQVVDLPNLTETKDEASSDKQIRKDFTTCVEDFLFEKLENAAETDTALASLLDYFLMHNIDAPSENTTTGLRNKRSTGDEENSSELLSLLVDGIMGNQINKDISEESEEEGAEAEEDKGNLDELGSKLDQLKNQLDAVPISNKNARISEPYQQPYQKLDYNYGKGMEKSFFSSLGKTGKKRTKKLDIFGKILDKIFSKIVDKIPVFVLRLLNSFFGLNRLDLSGQGGNYNSYDYKGGGGLQSSRGFGLVGLIPMLILKVVSNLSYFVRQLQRNRFLRNFLVPGSVLLGVSGMVVFLIWWLQPSDDYSQQYSKGYDGYYGNKNNYENGYYSNQNNYGSGYDGYYGNQNNYGNGYGNDQYKSSYKNGYNTNFYRSGSNYQMTPHYNLPTYRRQHYNPYVHQMNSNYKNLLDKQKYNYNT